MPLEPPRLAVLLACEKMLTDELANPSAISMFCALKIGFPPGVQITRTTMAPRKWCVIVMWLGTDKHIRQTYTQQIRIYTPSGDEFGKLTDQFTFEQISHTMRTDVEGMPVGLQGLLKITVWMEQDGKPVTEHFDYVVNIAHVSRQ